MKLQGEFLIMKRLFNNVFNTFAIGVGLAIVFIMAAVQRIEDRYDDEYFHE